MNSYLYYTYRKITCITITIIVIMIVIAIFEEQFLTGSWKAFKDPKPSKNVILVVEKNLLANDTDMKLAESKMSAQFESLSKRPIKSEFCNTLLIIAFNWPFYQVTPVLYEMYQYVFPKIVTCGSKSKNIFKPDIELNVYGGYQSYHCAAVAMQQYPGYEGYYLASDDMVVNWWTIHKFSKMKIWVHKPLFYPLKNAPFKDGWMHWNVEKCRRFNNRLELLSKSDSKMKKLFKTLMKSCNGEKCCARGWSDTFFVPRKHAENFITLSNMAYNISLFLETSVPLILSSLDDIKNHIYLQGDARLWGVWSVPKRVLFFQKLYNVNRTYHHPFKIGHDMKNGGRNIDILRKYIVSYTQVVTEKRNCTLPRTKANRLIVLAQSKLNFSYIGLGLMFVLVITIFHKKTDL